MNNEPVAWIKKKEIGYMEVTKKCGAKDYATNLGLVPEDDDIPLYTHLVKEQGNPVAWRSQDPDGYWSVYQSPVEGAEPLYTGFKQLTDEEIYEVWKKAMQEEAKIEYSIYATQLERQPFVFFARAILRKAQEK
jgi:hypothetical protein